MDIFEIITQTLASIDANPNRNVNQPFDILNYAALLSDNWKARCKTCIVNLQTCIIQKDKYVQFLTEQENEDYVSIGKEMEIIDSIDKLIEELGLILKTYNNLPLPASVVTQISNCEVFVYNQFMNEENRKTLLDEIDEEDRKVRLLNDLVSDVDRMWDNNDSEEAIKEHIFNKSKEIYLDKNEEEIRIISHDFFLYVTQGKSVRIALSNEQIENLSREIYKNSEESETCGTCLEEFVENDLTIILSCNHRFHPDCIVPWLKRSVACPTCRKDQRESIQIG